MNRPRESGGAGAGVEHATAGTGPPTFAAYWQRAVRWRAAAPFLVWEGPDHSVHQWTYEQFDQLVDEVTAWLADRGVVAGASVHLALRNSPGFVAVWLACARLAATMVPSDPQATAQELAEHLRRTRPVVSIGSREGSASHQGAIELARAERLQVQAQQIDEVDINFESIRQTGVLGPESPTPAPLDRLAVLFTSGTTSQPKGVEITQANYAFAGDVMAAAAQLGPTDRQLVVLPLFHANAQYYSVASAVSVGASVALAATFSATRFTSQVDRLEATHASLFAAPIRMILAKGTTPVCGGRLRHLWYAQNVTTEQYRSLAELVGCSPRQLYGMTETLAAVLTNPILVDDQESIGQPTLGCRTLVWDADTDAPAEPGRVGRLLVNGRPGFELFRGYLDDQATTDRAFVAAEDDGSVWFDTGDRAWVDHAGRHHFAGRSGDLLKVAGENVSTLEIETVLGEHPSVHEVAVVGRPDPIRDEVPVAFVVWRAGHDAGSARELEEVAVARLAPSKRPRRYVTVEELPRTSVGKIRKHLLVEPEPGETHAH